MKNRKKAYVHIISNLIIIATLLFVLSVTFNFKSLSALSRPTAEAIYNGNKSSNKVSLMINVYWGTEHLPQMLKTLKDHDVKCTFFVGGQWVEKEPEMLQQIYNDGHEIGNHGFFHRDHDKINYDSNYEEINVNHELVKQTIGIDMNLFAPPSGAFNKTTLDVANKLGYRTIMWSKDTIDWRDKNVSLIYSRATKNIKGGDLILMHPTECTAQALEDIITILKKDFNLCTVTENLTI